MGGQLGRILGRAILLGWAALGACGGEPPAPGLRFEHDLVDVGRMFAGPSLPISFPFTNGAQEVRVERIETSCGCIAPELFLDGVEQSLPAMIPPGARGEVRATYRTEGYSGRKLTGLTLFGTGPGLPRQLRVDSILDSWLELEPQVLDFGAIPGDAEVSASVRVRGRAPFRLSSLLSGSPELRVEGVPSPETGAEQSVRVVVLPNAEEGRHAAFLNLAADSGFTVRLAVAFEIEGRLWTRPGRMLLLGEIPFGIAATTAVEVGVREGRLDPPIAEISGLEGAHAEVRSIEEGSRYRVDLSLPDRLPEGAFTGQLHLRLRHHLGDQVQEVTRDLRLVGVVRKPS